MFAREFPLQNFHEIFTKVFTVVFFTKVLKAFTMGCPKGFHDGVAEGFSIVTEWVRSCVRA